MEVFTGLLFFFLWRRLGVLGDFSVVLVRFGFGGLKGVGFRAWAVRVYSLGGVFRGLLGLDAEVWGLECGVRAPGVLGLRGFGVFMGLLCFRALYSGM